MFGTQGPNYKKTSHFRTSCYAGLLCFFKGTDRKSERARIYGLWLSRLMLPIASGGTGARRDLRSDSHRREEPIRVLIHQNRMNNICDLCERSGRVLTFHHLVPRHCHGKKRFRRRFTLKEMRGNRSQSGIDVCE
jgi:hypothetical protein